MANYTTSCNRVKSGASVVLGASETDTVVSDTFVLSDQDSKSLLIKVVCTGVTSSAGITAKLQDSYIGSNFEDTASTVAITADGTVELSYDYVPGTNTPLWPICRVVVSTGAGDAVTVAGVYSTRRD